MKDRKSLEAKKKERKENYLKFILTTGILLNEKKQLSICYW